MTVLTVLTVLTGTVLTVLTVLTGLTVETLIQRSMLKPLELRKPSSRASYAQTRVRRR